LFQDLCAEGIADVVDFGSGDAEYKRHLCDQNRREASIFLFGPSLIGVSVNVLRTLFLSCATATHSVFSALGILQRTKRAWRDSMTRRGGHQTTRS
jgi:CelD/BcsL family acetyltransferase involved in cellulose biosynthesis